MVGEEEKVWPFVDPGKKRKKLRIWSRLWQDTEMMRAAAGKNENKEKWGMRFGPTRCAARPSSSSALAHIIHSPANITSGFQHKSSDSLWTAPLWFSFFGFFLLYPPVCLLVFSLLTCAAQCNTSSFLAGNSFRQGRVFGSPVTSDTPMTITFRWGGCAALIGPSVNRRQHAIYSVCVCTL